MSSGTIRFPARGTVGRDHRARRHSCSHGTRQGKALPDASEEVSCFLPSPISGKGRKAEEAWLDVEEGVMSVFSEYKSKLDIACDRRRPGIVRAFAFAELVCQPVSLLSVFAAGRAAMFRGRLLGARIGLLVISRYSHTHQRTN